MNTRLATTLVIAALIAPVTGKIARDTKGVSSVKNEIKVQAK